MFIECPACSARKFNLEPPPSGKEYRCQQCGAKFICFQRADTPESKSRKSWMALAWSNTAQLVVLVIAISLLLVFAGGSSLATAQPKLTVASLSLSTSSTEFKIPPESIGLIGDIRLVVAAYERNIVSIALQSMRVREGLKETLPVMVPTNDMASFPSAEYPLFPEYVGKRFSQFKYTVDSDGIVSVDTSAATSDTLTERIEHLFDQ